MNTYEVTLEFEPVTLTVEANNEEEALDRAAADFDCNCEHPDIDEFMSDVELVEEGDDEEEQSDEYEPLPGQLDLFGGEYDE